MLTNNYKSPLISGCALKYPSLDILSSSFFFSISSLWALRIPWTPMRLGRRQIPNQRVRNDEQHWFKVDRFQVCYFIFRNIVRSKMVRIKFIIVYYWFIIMRSLLFLKISSYEAESPSFISPDSASSTPEPSSGWEPVASISS